MNGKRCKEKQKSSKHPWEAADNLSARGSLLWVWRKEWERKNSEKEEEERVNRCTDTRMICSVGWRRRKANG